MPISQARNALRMLTSGAPRLWQAARGAGAGPAAATEVVMDSALAFSSAVTGSPTQWRRQNAVRHFVWQALLTARHGEAVAAAVGEAQEQGSADARDSEVDRANNELGRAYGSAHAAELTRLGRRDAVTRLAGVAAEKWASRELSAQPLADGRDPRDVVG